MPLAIWGLFDLDMTRNISLQLLSLGLPPLHQRCRVPNLSLHAMMLRSKLQVILGVAPVGCLQAQPSTASPLVTTVADQQRSWIWCSRKVAFQYSEKFLKRREVAHFDDHSAQCHAIAFWLLEPDLRRQIAIGWYLLFLQDSSSLSCEQSPN